jgi:hypothetical protein
MGGRPVAFSALAPPGSGDDEFGDDKSAADDDEHEGNRPGTLGSAGKNVLDLTLGATQVLDRRTLLQVSASYGRAGGYQTDPYKVLSVVDPVSGNPSTYLYESRPDLRLRHALAGRIKHHFGWSVLDLSYRYYTDDWGVRSHTEELRLRWPLSEATYLQPHLRHYRQTAADFYRRFLLDGAPLPENASADYRLGAFDARTIGLELGTTLASGHTLRVRAEYYWQVGDSHPASVPPGLRPFDLFPTVDAVIVQVGYTFSVP